MVKCPQCGHQLKQEVGKKKFKVILLDEEDREFIRESNAIEREYSAVALVDAEEAYRYGYRHLKKINYKNMLEIHRRLMVNLNPRIAGKIRKVEVRVGSRVCLNSLCIHDELKRLFKEWEEWKLNIAISGGRILNAEWKEKYIKDWHIRFEHIHPFEDGNGRVGRILMNLQRLALGLPILVIHEGKEQQEYYKWFKEELY